MRNDEAPFAFGPWETPFENARVELRRVEYRNGGALEFDVHDLDADADYRVSFAEISAFRVLDEHGLQELWEKTSELGERPGASSFKVRNHAWTRESPITFLASEGWSYIVATDFDCIEIVSVIAPCITQAA